jgi:hypothetical protein
MKEHPVLTPIEWETYAREWELWTQGKLVDVFSEEIEYDD